MSPCNGRMMVVEVETVSDGAGIFNVFLMPAGVGIEWEILWAIGQQDDGAVQHGWSWVDPEHPAGVDLYMLAGVANVPLPLGALDSDLPNVSMGPWWATWARRPRYRFDASGAGKTGKIIAIVIEHVGVEGLD